MPFFPQAYLSPENTLINLLSALEDPQNHKSACGPRAYANRHNGGSYNPKFDVTELPEQYELFGELPGLAQDDLSIEFSDAQTIVVKGKTERVAEAVAATSSPQQAAATSTVTASILRKDAETSSVKSHTPTAEDDYDEADTPLITPATTSATTTAANNGAAPQQQQAGSQPEGPKPKYWVAERKVGEFARSFSFSQRVEQDFVTATLKNGILHVVVPKSQKPKKVAVNVY